MPVENPATGEIIAQVVDGSCSIFTKDVGRVVRLSAGLEFGTVG